MYCTSLRTLRLPPLQSARNALSTLYNDVLDYTTIRIGDITHHHVRLSA